MTMIGLRIGTVSVLLLFAALAYTFPILLPSLVVTMTVLAFMGVADE